MAAIGILSSWFLSFANGGNDNFKGVATLWGSRLASFRSALMWSTVSTFVGSVIAVFLAERLLKNFSGKGLVNESVLTHPLFPIAVALGAATTVLIATRKGLPISTTHALVGGLVGTGLAVPGSEVSFSKLYDSFLLPLMLSPFLSLALAAGLYPLLSGVRRRLGVKAESCLCIGREVVSLAPANVAPGSAMTATLSLDFAPQIEVGTTVECRRKYSGQVIGFEVKRLLDIVHFLSGGLVCLARGLNDTPKIAALLVLTAGWAHHEALASVGVVMVVGGLLLSYRIAQTMAKDVTEMNEGQGLTANLVTSGVVLGASFVGLPVSTTHVSCGALFGIGGVTGQGHWKVIGKIVAAWLVTLPMAAVCGAIWFKVLGLI